MKYEKHRQFPLIILFVLNCLLINIAYADIDFMSLEIIKARIKPVGEVNIAKPGQPTAVVPVTLPPQSSAVANVGQKFYQAHCIVCHATGVAGAPKFKDTEAWKPRIAKGMDVLFSHVKNGFNVMPPKGTCVECSDDDLKAAIEYITK